MFRLAAGQHERCIFYFLHFMYVQRECTPPRDIYTQYSYTHHTALLYSPQPSYYVTLCFMQVNYPLFVKSFRKQWINIPQLQSDSNWRCSSKGRIEKVGGNRRWKQKNKKKHIECGAHTSADKSFIMCQQAFVCFVYIRIVVCYFCCVVLSFGPIVSTWPSLRGYPVGQADKEHNNNQK